MYFLYSLLLAAGLVVGLPFWLYQVIRHGKYTCGLGERLGRVPARLLQNKRSPTIWIHAVSVGEVLAISNLVEQLRQEMLGHRIVISTTTDTGQKLARVKFGEENVFYFPLDFASCVRPYLLAFKPELVILAETEFWPNFLRLSRESGAVIATVNARISDRSFPGYRRWKRWLSRILQNVDLFLAQTLEDQRRLVAIGASAERVQVSGNLKYDVAPPSAPEIVARLRESFQRSDSPPVFVAGSTVDMEEEGLLLHAFRNVLTTHPAAVMILAPRHPERFDQVADRVHDFGIPVWRRRSWNGEAIKGGILLLDTIGELSAIYSLADVAFVGGSLVPRGGHNIIEPAQYGVPIIVGNHTENFRDIVGLFQSRGAVKIVGPAEFPLVLMELLADPSQRAELGRCAKETLQSQMGATQRTVAALKNLLLSTPPRAGAS
ncbi:MAG TPA: 3-deoxy-D-manno-octulosonic acid transferase [Terriglobales bacterium]